MKKLYKHKKVGGNNLIVVFQSMNAHLYNEANINKFELENTFSKLNIPYCDLLFIKDDVPPRQSMVGGFYLHSEKVEDIVSWLNNIKSQYNKTLFAGISAGGFASILFGSLCLVDLVVAVTPQTSFYDFNDGHILLVPEEGESDCDNSKYYDLKPHINKKTIYCIKNNTYKKYEECSLIEKLHSVKMYEHISEFDNVVETKVRNDFGDIEDILKIYKFNITY